MNREREKLEKAGEMTKKRGEHVLRIATFGVITESIERGVTAFMERGMVLMLLRERI